MFQACDVSPDIWLSKIQNIPSWIKYLALEVAVITA